MAIPIDRNKLAERLNQTESTQEPQAQTGTQNPSPAVQKPQDRYTRRDREFLAAPTQELEIKPSGVEMAEDHNWTWKPSRVGNLMKRELRRHGITPVMIDIPLEAMTPATRARFQGSRISASASRELRRAVRRTGSSLRRIGRRTGNTTLVKAGDLAHRLAAENGGRMTASQAKSLYDIMHRLRQSDEMDATDADVTQVTGADDVALISEVLLNFSHNRLGMDLLPAGYRIYFSSQARPTAAEYDADGDQTVDYTGLYDHMFDFGMININPDLSRYFAHFAETASVLDPTVNYHVWLTAYNTENDVEGESTPSTPPKEMFIRSGVRGDIDADGDIDLADVNLLMGILVDGSKPMVRADVTADGVVSQEDLDALLAKIENG